MAGIRGIQQIRKKFCASVFCVVLFLTVIFHMTALAEGNAQQVIRVGGFPYEELLRVGENGSYSGYGYEYLEKIASYTGWKYEFVDASWSECMAMLERGDIDLLGAVMRSPEREEVLDFADHPMISGYGILVTPLSNEELPYEDFSAFSGLKVGVIQGNLNRDTFLAYSRAHRFTPRIREYSTQVELDSALNIGEVDAAIMTNILHSSTLRVVASFGETDAYFATAKGNTAVLNQINEAMRQIILNDPYYNNRLDKKYYDLQASTVISFSKEELDYIRQAPPIPCAYIPEAPPISYYDKSTGSVQGISADICKLLAEKTGLEFTWLQPKSSSEADSMLKDGEALLLPARYNDYNWAGLNNATLTDSYLQGQMIMVSRAPNPQQEIVALYDEGVRNQLTEGTVSEDAQFKQYDTVLDCMNAVLDGKANMTFINSTTASYLGNNPRYAQLKSTPLYDFPADLAMAVSDKADPMLLSVINKGLRSISTTEINQIVLSRMKTEQTGRMAEFLYSHSLEVLWIICIIFISLIVVLVFFLRNRANSIKAIHKTLYTDALTGYPNYRALEEDAAVLIENHRNNYALLYLDIRKFKVINDTFGYEIGDQVLIATSEILDGFVGSGERFARLYADTFVLLLKYDDLEQLKRRLDELSFQLEQLPIKREHAVHPLYCGGVYPLSEGFGDLDQACDRANYAKDSISNHFANTFVFYDDVMRRRVLDEKELESSMLSAVEHEEFIPYYQPKVNAITGQVAGAEALVRWMHPEKGLMSPAEFLPFFEKNGFIIKIDMYIFEHVCRDISAWLQQGYKAVPVSVNFSRQHMRDEYLPKKLWEIADRYGIPTSLLEIEITETEELESLEAASNLVVALKAYGFNVSIDDYGTGYSSISFLQELPLDVLKLDRGFILNAMKSERAKDIMRYLVTAMMKNGIQVICEGVETEEQRDFVVNLNCRLVQGYFYSAPLPREEFEAYLLGHGMEEVDYQDFLPMVNFEKDQFTGAEDFLDSSTTSWLICCFMEPGYPVYYISANFLEGLGYSALEFEEATKGMFINLIHPDDQPPALQRLEEYKHSQRNFSLQYRLRKKDGDYIWIRETNKRVMSENGREALLSICVDISDVVMLQMEKLSLIDTIPGGVGEMVLTKEGPIVRQATDHFYEVLGYTPKQLEEVGNNICNILYQQDLPIAMDQLQILLDGASSSCDCRFRVCRPDGSLHWISFQGSVFRVHEEYRITVIIYNSDQEMDERQKLEITRAKLELALTLRHHAVFEYDICSMCVYSHNGFGLYGISNDMVLDVHKDLVESGFIHPEDVIKLRAVQEKIAAGETVASYEIRVRSKFSVPNAPFVWIQITLSTIFDEDKHPVRAIGIVENINQQRSFEFAFMQEAQFRKAFTESSLMAYEVNLTKDTIQRISGIRGFRLLEACQEMPEPYSYSKLLPAATAYLVAEDDRELFQRENARERLEELYLGGTTEQEVEYRRLTPDGQELWNSVLIHLLLDQLSGDIMGYAYHRDINERKRMERGLVDQASRDSLTGILNRSAAERMIQTYLQSGGTLTRIQAFLMIDLDRFKELNDTYGHLTGDNCLIRVTKVMKKNLREDDFIARMGGDEFSILLKNLSDAAMASTIAQKLYDSIKEIGPELGIELETTASIGIAIAPMHGTDFEQLYKHADEALYIAKKKPEAHIVVFEG